MTPQQRSLIKVHPCVKKAVKSFSENIQYKISTYIPLQEELSGKGVKIAILDSGEPSHPDVAKSKCESISFTSSDIKDKIGHASLLAGIISANNPEKIVGFAPNAKMFYGKVIDDKGKGDFNALVTGVLWAIIKDVDIIVMAIGSECNYNILHDAIKKARNMGICIFSASGNATNVDDVIDIYPSSYSEVFSVGSLKKDKALNEKIRTTSDFVIPSNNLYTLNHNKEYIMAKGSSISTAFFAGIGACLVEYCKYKKIKKEDRPKQIYDMIINNFK